MAACFFAGAAAFSLYILWLLHSFATPANTQFVDNNIHSYLHDSISSQ